MAQLKIKVILLIILFAANSILPQEKQNKSIYLSPFNSYKSNEEARLSEKLIDRLSTKLKSLGYKVVLLNEMGLNQCLSKSKQEGAYLLVGGNYRREENGNLNIYGQIYHPDREVLIDAYNQANDLTGIEGVMLDPNETKISEAPADVTVITGTKTTVDLPLLRVHQEHNTSTTKPT